MTDAAPLSYHSGQEHRRIIAEIVNSILDGKINAVGSFTLTANDTTTTLTDRRIGGDSVIKWMPTTATAATAMTALYTSSRGDGTATLTHDNTADTDRTFDYAVLG